MSAHPRLLSRLETFLASERGRRILNRFYSWGAAFVILGALFKLLHIRYGDEILLVSMLTEFVVFFISGFERPEKSYDWEAVFPELRGAEEVPLSDSISRRASRRYPQRKWSTCVRRLTVSGRQLHSWHASALYRVR